MKTRLILTTLLLAAASQASAQDTVRLSLGGAARLAAERNTQVAEAQARVEQARARSLNQRSYLLPQVSAAASQSGHTLNTATFGLEFPTAPGEEPLFDPDGEVIGPIKLSDVRGRLTQTLFDLSALRRVKSANAAVDAAEAQLHAAAQRAGSNAANAYVQALRAQQIYNNRRADVALSQELLTIARQQLESGTGVRLDVTRAEAQLAAVNAQMIAARNALERTQLALTRALDLPPTTVVALTDSLPVTDNAAPDAEEAVHMALENRADIEAVDAQIRSAELQASAIRAERLPSLNFVGDDGFIGKSWDTLLHTYTWAVQVSVPLFSGMRTTAREQEQRAQLSELKTRRHELEQQYSFEARAAVLDLSGASELVDAASARLRLAEQELQDARDRFQSGVAGTADVVTASLRLNEARTAHSEALVAYQSARVALAAAEGNVTELP